MYFNDGFTYNIATNEVKFLFSDPNLKFDSLHNQCAQIRPGQIAAMVRLPNPEDSS